MDCDDACPAELGPELLRRSRMVRGDVPIFVALAHREFESWFIAGLESLRRFAAFKPGVEKPPVVEAFRDAKGWLNERLSAGYDPVINQAAFTAGFALEEAAGSSSFARLLTFMTHHFQESLER
ncbi:MAG: hypothetical protein SFU53_13115 [Terrimicrobiaceae bacterium]|nr:hypothetical protein [Terrimicrobiaceae bacterium]